jgi:primosomal protein N' (replication factor Y)
MTAARARVLTLLADGLAHGKSETAQEAGVSPGVVDGLIDEGTLETLVLPPAPLALAPDPDYLAPDFTPAQAAAAAALRATIASGGYSVTLIDGVTGSGKTQVYFEAVAETVRGGRQADPDASRAHRPGARRFAERFGRGQPNGIRSSPAQAARTAATVAAGDVSVIVGARSALFPATQNLSLIVVDEELIRLQAGEGCATMPATWRWCAAILPDSVMLASATPSVATEVNARAPASTPASAGTFRRGASAGDRDDRSAREARRPGAVAPILPAVRTRSSAASRRSCSSIERLCAADAAANAGFAQPVELRRLAGHRFKRRLVCHHCDYSLRRRSNVRNAGHARACGLRAGVGGSREEAGRCFPRPHPGAFQRASWHRSSACARAGEIEQAGSTSSSVRNSSPRGILSQAQPGRHRGCWSA